jgi:uncharacterized RDD family membrane protein YckC
VTGAARLDTLHTAETPEGIALSLRPAGLMARSLAWLLDLLVRMVLFIIISIAGRAFGGLGTALLLISFFALEWLYPVVFELSRSGATPGKRAMGLRVVMDSGLPVTPAASFIRNLLRTADFLPAMYAAAVVTMLLRDDSKRLGDLAAGTLVVFVDSVQLHGEPPMAEPRAPSRPLTPTEQTAIVALAGRAKRLTPERFEELATLALPVLGGPDTGASPATASQRLLGVAQWVLGRRREQAP